MDEWSDPRVITGWALIALCVIAAFLTIGWVQTSPQNTITTCIEQGRFSPAQCREAAR